MNRHTGKTFTLTSQHIALLRAAYVDWDDCETGAPAIDPKRPYGNSYVAKDVAEILGYEPMGEEYGDGSRALTEEQEQELLEIHYETGTALQIVLSTGEFKPGVYKRGKDYSHAWVEV